MSGTSEAEIFTAASAVERLKELPRFSSGSKALDALLGGGYQAGRTFEVFGRSNSGKTQLAMQAALIGAMGGVSILFIDTEGSFRPERVLEMAEARGWDARSALQRIVYLRADSLAEQLDAITRIDARAATRSSRIVVVDSLTRNFSLELPGSLNLAARQGAIGVHLSEMARDAFLRGRAYLLTNRVTFGQNEDVGIGGRTVVQLVHAVVRLQRSGNKVRMTLADTGASQDATVGRAGVE